ncbi:MAG TPA: ATP-binding cassette domain-containing protein [Gemmatimonadales bacterium]|jgi:ABC-type transporter Mla maintaining outer membrane lipid asymmetry ATPase subunit MlaF
MIERESFLVQAYEMGVEGAAPLVFKDVDLRERPDHPGHRLDLVVEVGAVTAVLGDEDSGVGDMGRFVLGLDRPPWGKVLVYGTEIADLPWRKLLIFRRRLGYVPVGDGLLQNLTLAANIGLPLQYASDHRQKAVDERVDELLTMFHLADVATLRPAAVNEEIRRRSAVARAIALDPDLLVLEAPFDGLTHRAAHEIIEHVRHTRFGTPRTVVITAQDLGPHVIPLMNRLVHVEDGLAMEGLE